MSIRTFFAQPLLHGLIPVTYTFKEALSGRCKRLVKDQFSRGIPLRFTRDAQVKHHHLSRGQLLHNRNGTRNAVYMKLSQPLMLRQLVVVSTKCSHSERLSASRWGREKSFRSLNQGMYLSLGKKASWHDSCPLRRELRDKAAYNAIHGRSLVMTTTVPQMVPTSCPRLCKGTILV